MTDRPLEELFAEMHEREAVNLARIAAEPPPPPIELEVLWSRRFAVYGSRTTAPGDLQRAVAVLGEPIVRAVLDVVDGRAPLLSGYRLPDKET